MNLVTELENELVYALLVEKKHPEQLDREIALVLIDNIKAALQPDSVTNKATETNLSVGKKVDLLSH